MTYTEASASGLFKEFNLAEANQSTQYATLFEYYKINKIVVSFRYKATATPTTINTTAAPYVNEVNPLLYFKVDHNDITQDTLATMKKSMKTREHQFTNDKPNFDITLKPALQAESYKSSIATTYTPKWGQWLSTGDLLVPHYGLKAYAVGPSGLASNGTIKVSYKIYFSVKNNE